MPRRVEQADAVVGHVVERVAPAAFWTRASSCSGVGAAAASIVRRAADVAVVVADDVEARGRPASAQKSSCQAIICVAEAHDEQQRRVGGVAEGLVGELDVADPGRHLGHGGRAYPSPGDSTSRT